MTLGPVRHVQQRVVMTVETHRSNLELKHGTLCLALMGEQYDISLRKLTVEN